MHLQPVFKSCVNYSDGTSERMFRDGLCLPSDTKMTDGEIGEIISIIRDRLKT